jgi:hypothetical protein
MVAANSPNSGRLTPRDSALRFLNDCSGIDSPRSVVTTEFPSRKQGEEENTSRMKAD